MTPEEEEQVALYYETAIVASLGSDLPAGATVTVTSVENGEVEYFITMNVDSSTDATTAQNSITTSMSDSNTMTEINQLVSSTAASSSNPAIAGAMAGASVTAIATETATVLESVSNALAGADVDSNTAGTTTEETLAKVTSTGQLTTSLSGLTDPTQIEEASSYFESAIEDTLRAAGSLPAGSSVEVTGIDAAGNVSYTITMLLLPGADNAVIVNEINTELADGATLAAIAEEVTSAATEAGSAISALSTLDVTGFIKGETSGVSFKKWYPNWVTFGQYCNNDGLQPPFMKEDVNEEDYLFDTQADCCERWFAYADDCVGAASSPSSEKFYPVYGTGGCSKKQVKDFEAFEQDRYDTLEACCSDKFSFGKRECCDSPGMGGCGTSGEVVYLPDWSNNQCEERSKSTLAVHEEAYAKASEKLCCNEFFGWEGNDCFKKSS
jgi:hypothetical protein